MNIRRIANGRKQTWPDDEVGSKAANLARMAALGLPVPPAFVLPIENGVGAAEANGRAEQQLAEALNEGIAYLETATGAKFGDRRRPLLVSVRSGAAVSMPGMLNTCSMSAAHRRPPMGALIAAALGVRRSFWSDRARTYRKLQKLEHLKGSAVTVQAMVFGNRGRSSGSGVAFSRDPSTGNAEPVIDVLFDAQGEDVVSGRRTPRTEAAIDQAMPGLAAQLRDVLARLERHFRDVQDVEFTIEDRKLWILQTRAAKRTPRAALRFAVDFMHEGLLSPAEAARRLEGLDRAALAINHFAETGHAAARGTGAAAGVAVGRAAFDSSAAQRLAAEGNPVTLVRPDTSTADVAGFSASAAILTAAGGRTAHAALVARHMRKPCVVGCEALRIDQENRQGWLGDARITERDSLSIDGGSGEVFLGPRKIVTELPEAELRELESWRAENAVRQSRTASRDHDEPVLHSTLEHLQGRH